MAKKAQRTAKAPEEKGIVASLPAGMQVVEGGQTFGDFLKMEKPGDSFTGILKGTRVVEGDFGPQNVFDCETEDGRKVTLPGHTDLESKLFRIPFGTRIHLVLERLKRIKKRKEPFRMYMVSADESATLAELPDVEDGADAQETPAPKKKRAAKK